MTKMSLAGIKLLKTEKKQEARILSRHQSLENAYCTALCYARTVRQLNDSLLDIPSVRKPPA